MGASREQAKENFKMTIRRDPSSSGESRTPLTLRRECTLTAARPGTPGLNHVPLTLTDFRQSKNPEVGAALSRCRLVAFLP
jgi:hypothetical protein